MKRLFWLIAAGLAILLIAGCKPICATEALMAPVPDTPGNWQVIDTLLPSLSWTYPDDSCTPEGYRIELDDDPFGSELGGGTGNPSTSWSPGSALTPVTQYWWRVTAINDTTLGPPSDWWRFFTGPLCDPDDPIPAPVMVSPPNGSTVNSSSVIMRIGFPDGCIIQGAWTDISRDPSFSDVDDPDTYIGYDWPLSTAWTYGSLEDCTTYYWRSMLGTDRSNHGPFSYSNFYVDLSGSCPPAGTPGIISGTVWLDTCTLPGAGPFATPPDGCEEWGSGIYWGDAIRQPGEDGISNVAVALSPGPCPAGFGDTVLTDLEGRYEFLDIAPGDYCLAINASAAGSPLPMEGRWTIVPSGHEGWTYRAITLHTGEELNGLDFAWSLLRYTGLPTVVPESGQDVSLKPCSEMGEQECQSWVNSDRCQWFTGTTQGPNDKLPTPYFYCADK